MRARSSASSRQIRHRAHDLIHRVRVEEQRGAIHHFGHRRSVGANHRPTARHRFERRQSETFVKRRKGKDVAGVVQLQQVAIGDEAEELDAVGHARFARRLMHSVRKPGLLSGQHQPMLATADRRAPCARKP